MLTSLSYSSIGRTLNYGSLIVYFEFHVNLPKAFIYTREKQFILTICTDIRRSSVISEIFCNCITLFRIQFSESRKLIYTRVHLMIYDYSFSIIDILKSIIEVFELNNDIQLSIYFKNDVVKSVRRLVVSQFHNHNFTKYFPT